MKERRKELRRQGQDRRGANFDQGLSGGWAWPGTAIDWVGGHSCPPTGMPLWQCGTWRHLQPSLFESADGR
jgi:hypothetical protein